MPQGVCPRIFRGHCFPRVSVSRASTGLRTLYGSTDGRKRYAFVCAQSGARIRYLSLQLPAAFHGAGKIITDTIDAHIQAERGRKDDDDGTAGVLVPVGYP
jgi:hypothetical protein